MVESPATSFVWPKWDERRRQLFLRKVKQGSAATISLSKPLDQPERVKCKCGCDHFKINVEGHWTRQHAGKSAGVRAIINSVECERCHEIYVLEVAA